MTQTIENAVAEAIYVSNSLGEALQAFEIGNEPDLYAGVGYAHYESLWDSVAAAIIAAIPGAFMSGPAIASTGNIASWIQPFALAEKGRRLTVLTQHRYVAASGTDATLLNDVGNATKFMQELKSLANANGMAWRLSETGSYYNATYSPSSGSVAMDFASALWALDYLFASVANGGQGVNLHNGNLVQYSSEVPFSDDEVNSVTFVNAVYYGMLLFSLGGTGDLVPTSLSEVADVTTYTVMVDANHYSTWILNKDQTSSRNLIATVKLPSAVKTATIKLLQAAALDAHDGIAIQGSSVGVDGAFDPAPDYIATIDKNTVTCYAPYNCAILVQTVLS